ncbi:MAG TPA: restriction endonuclease [Pseudonocardiaceae bacterium]|nr:restriction endonuclease [Pseudonocardiaceae bacterium]
MAQGKRPQWLEYEKLAAKIISELSPHASVQHNDHIVGRESESRRQIDVAARWTDGQSDRLLIVQVRDYKRHADVNVVGEFRSVIQDVRADRGVLICSGGFSRNAMNYARNLGIDLYSLTDAQSKRWELELTISVIWNRLTPHLHLGTKVHVVDVPFTVQLREDNSPPLFLDNAGSRYDLMAEFMKSWESGSLDFTVGAEHIFPPGPQLYIEGTNTEGVSQLLRLHELTVTYKVAKESYLAHLTPSDYRGLVDHLNDQCFLPSFMTIDVPSLESDQWSRVRNPDKLAIRTGEIFITAEDARIEPGQWKDFNLKYLGPG